MSRLGGRLLWACGGVLLAATAFPLYWAVVSSLTAETTLFAGPSLWPNQPNLDHYRALFVQREFLLPVRNSFVVAGLTTLVTLPVAAAAAYAIARLPMRGKTPLMALILAVAMFPQISIVPPLYLILRELRLLDTYSGLVLPYLTFSAPLAIWLLTGFFRQLPRDLEEAAMLDGASRLRVLRDVVLPVAAPGLASTAILTFLFCWNEFLFALSFALGPDRYTVPVAIALFRGRYVVPWGEVLAAAVIATVPVAVVVVLFQRYIVSGLTAGATKG